MKLCRIFEKKKFQYKVLRCRWSVTDTLDNNVSRDSNISTGKFKPPENRTKLNFHRVDDRQYWIFSKKINVPKF